MILEGYIEISAIPQDRITIGKNGKEYLNVIMFYDEGQPDKFGNVASICLRQNKQEYESKAKKIYLGNFKKLEKKER
jgi:hypothetical protein